MTLEQSPAEVPGQPSLTPTEQTIAELWCEILQPASPLSARDNFFSLGGDSLAMTMVLFRINEVFQVELPTTALLETPELGSFAALIDAARQPADQTMDSSVL